MQSKSRIGGVFTVICRDAQGKEKWREEAKNLMVTDGLQHILDTEFTGSSQVTTWYVGLTGTAPTPAAGHTLASHTGWTEFTDYTGDRKEWSKTRSSLTLSNSSSKAEFAVDTNSSTIGGAFIVSAASGTSGTLMSCAAFSGGDKSADNGDTLSVQYDLTIADNGS